MKEDLYYFNQTDNSKKIAGLLLCGISYCDGSYEITRNASPIACIEYILSGCGTVQTAGKLFHPSAGDSYFLHSGHDQHYYSDADEPWVKLFINYAGSLEQHFTALYQLQDAHYFPHTNLYAELSEIIALAKNTQQDITKPCTHLLHQIFQKLYDKTCLEPLVPLDAQKMKNYLDAHIKSADLASLDEVSACIFKSKSQAIRIFKKAYGVTPHAYVLEQKIRMAKIYLTSTNMTLHQIAQELCFADQYYFSNIFKEKVGGPPSVYRKEPGL